MGKKKNQVKRKQQTQSFQEAISNISVKKMEQYIDQKVLRLAQVLTEKQKSSTESMFVRIVALEKLLMEKFDVDKNDIITYVSNVEDERDGYELKEDIDAVVEKSDRVRVEISTKSKDQDTFQGTSRMVINNVGSGEQLGEELESKMLGLKVNEPVESDFGQDMMAKIVVEKISSLKLNKEDNSNEN